jgi:hypothetical protein
MAAESHPYRRLHLFETSTATQARAPQQDEDEEGDFEDIGVVKQSSKKEHQTAAARPHTSAGHPSGEDIPRVWGQTDDIEWQSSGPVPSENKKRQSTTFTESWLLEKSAAKQSSRTQ